ncbi:family 78 glycoside hydrolase catalytic domain [Samsonia erythrinae]|uniref:alpha-L-rhamnosidase n=1 Tax=Samsonia erythrinae TaxID=160434 RepID=A0A4R3VTJ4_9GAMM|nr:alpha-L-rhamnosidase [Samsonia erythrinae]TCV08572.1 alpha-L-rhamnosidase [Samsonia erythrinae]
MTQVTQITCFGADSLLGVARENLLFSWLLASERRNVVQRQYRLQLALDTAFDELQFDSGWVLSDQSVNVPLSAFIPLSRTRYYFRVRVIDDAQQESAWSPAGWFETALQHAHEWKADWITPDRDDEPAESVYLLRRLFTAGKKVASARLYSSALGVYRLYLNGSPVGDDLFSPGWTSYDDHIQFQSADVTSLLVPGDNALGAMLGEGWFKGELTWLKKRELYGRRKALLAQLHLLFEDGEECLIVTDGEWRCCNGPILDSGFYAGETYDARREDPCWCSAHSAAEWQPVTVMGKQRYRLVPQISEPVRVTQTLTPVAFIRTDDGVIVDMGQNMVGRIRLRAELEEGQTITLRHAEVLDTSGKLYTDNLRNARQTVTYTARGGSAEYAPYFSFQGFRYVEITGLSHLNDESLSGAICGEVLHTDMMRTGEFSCSNPAINRLFDNIVWGQRGNFVDVPTDCPQRDERLGWTGDAQIFIRTAAYNYDVRRFFRKWLLSVAADQKPNGSVPVVVPNVLLDYISKIWGDETYTSSGWGDAAVICPWTVYQFYGDRQLLAEQYSSMKAWVNYIHSRGDDPWLWNTDFQFGDWLALDAEPDSYFGATPVYLVATAFYALSTRIVRDAAAALNLRSDERKYRLWHENIVAAFRRTFMREGEMIADTQTAHILPLAFGLLEGADRVNVAARLNQLVVEQDYHLTTGFLGTPWLCVALSENGYHDTAVKLACQESYPSWLFSVSQGATTVWEHWDGIKPDGSFWSENMNSFNHYAYGAIGEWFYRFVAGIDFAPDSVACGDIIFRPDLSGGSFTSAAASYRSVRGIIAIRWERHEEHARLWLTVPANARAVLRLADAQWSVLVDESDRKIRSLEDVGGAPGIALGSGEYHFSLGRQKGITVE